MLNKQQWAAYALNGEVLLKRYSYEEGAEYPDYGCNTEIFTNADMLELETLGSLTNLPPGESVEHTEYWLLAKAIFGDDEAEIQAALAPLVAAAE